MLGSFWMSCIQNESLHYQIVYANFARKQFSEMDPV